MIGQVRVRVTPFTDWILETIVRPSSSMLSASARAMTSYGPVTTSADVTPSSCSTALATADASPTSDCMRTMASTKTNSHVASALLSYSTRRGRSTRPFTMFMEVTDMRAIAVVSWLGIVGALLVWQGIGLVRGPEWPTLSDFFRSFMTVPLGRFVLFGLWLWLGWHLFIRGWSFFLRG